MDKRLKAPWLALRLGIGLTAALAGLDKFFYLLADWSDYLSPLAVQLLPVAPDTFMMLVGVIEIGVGAAILAGWTRFGAYTAAVWLASIAANLVLAGYFDVAVRDIVMALGSFALARLEEVRRTSLVHEFSPSLEQANRRLTA